MNIKAKFYSEVLDGENVIYVNYFKKWMYHVDLHSWNSYFNLYLNTECLRIFKRLNPKGNYTYIETSEIESMQTYLFKF